MCVTAHRGHSTASGSGRVSSHTARALRPATPARYRSRYCSRLTALMAGCRVPALPGGTRLPYTHRAMKRAKRESATAGTLQQFGETAERVAATTKNLEKAARLGKF